MRSRTIPEIFFRIRRKLWSTFQVCKNSSQGIIVTKLYFTLFYQNEKNLKKCL
eukprot:UN13549